jgi:hypothetical protein
LGFGDWGLRPIPIPNPQMIIIYNCILHIIFHKLYAY